jgi:hypothetical protein
MLRVSGPERPADAGAGPLHGGEDSRDVKAEVGDRLLPDGDPDRAAVIISVPHADGYPPYVVKWLSDGHIALVFPGPYTRIVRRSPPAGTARPA